MSVVGCPCRRWVEDPEHVLFVIEVAMQVQESWRVVLELRSRSLEQKRYQNVGDKNS